MLIAAGFQWWLEFLKFIFAVFIAFYIPGSLFLNWKTTNSFLVYFTLATLIGLVLWAWQEFILGYLSLRILSYFYLSICLIIWLVKIFRNSFITIKNRSKSVDFFIIFIILTGVFIQTFPIWGNGVSFQNGLLFTGGDISDNLWHAALTKEIIKRFPPHEPGLPSVLVHNYHYWSNMTVAGLIRIFKLPLFPTQFQFFPLFISLFLGLTSVALGKILNLKKEFIYWLLFFIYFGGDLIYLILIILRRGPNFFIMSSLEDGTKFLYNPPRAFSFVIALGGISLFILWQKSKKTTLGLLSMFLLASTIGFKVYTNLFFLPGISLLALFSLLKKKWNNLLIFFSFYLLTAIIYFPVNINAGGLILAPFSIVNDFIVQPPLGLQRWELARRIFLEDNKQLHNLIFEIFFTIFFLFGVLGTKLIGLFQPPSSFIKLKKPLLTIIALGILSSLVAGIFFIQKSGGANTFNFIVSIFLFLSIPAALSMNYWQNRLHKKTFVSLAFLVILLTIPRVISETIRNIQIRLNHAGYFISQEELQLYKHLNSQSSPNHPKTAVDNRYGLTSHTPYISLFLENPLLITGNKILKSHGINISNEEKIQKLIFEKKSEKLLIQQLVNNQIEYIILYKDHSLPATESAYFTSVLTKNKAGSVLEVNKEKLIKRLLDYYFKKQGDEGYIQKLLYDLPLER